MPDMSDINALDGRHVAFRRIAVDDLVSTTGSRGCMLRISHRCSCPQDGSTAAIAGDGPSPKLCFMSRDANICQKALVQLAQRCQLMEPRVRRQGEVTDRLHQDVFC